MAKKLQHQVKSTPSFIPQWAWISILYAVIHFPGLLRLPVFADEAIYIHWAQLVIDDAARYAFFSMSDGKPPLFMWLLSLTLRPFADPLFAARATAVGIGLLTTLLMGELARTITGNKRVVLLTQLMTTIAPFWWFYHRMALMDGLLTLCIAAAFYFGVRIAKRCQIESAIAYDTIPYVLSLAVSFAGALLTKTPALFAIPVIALTPFFALVKRTERARGVRERLQESFLLVGIGGFIGCLFFGLLKVSPFFGALFARSSDFTFSIKEVLAGEWKFVLLSSIPREFGWISWYMTIAAAGAAVSGLFFRQTRRLTALLLVAAFLFAAPLVAFGRVLYPRYFLPIAPFVTIAAAIGIDRLWTQSKLRIAAVALILAFLIQSALFIYPALTNPAQIPFSAIDRMQYLSEWSAGYGNTEVRDYIRARYKEVGKSKRIIVLTEGAFGTLPDGLSIYFCGANQLDGVEIHGIGVGPNVIPEEYRQLLPANEVYYVVNSHRLRISDMSTLEKIFEVKRPDAAPSLELFRVMR